MQSTKPGQLQDVRSRSENGERVFVSMIEVLLLPLLAFPLFEIKKVTFDHWQRKQQINPFENQQWCTVVGKEIP